MSSFAPLVQWSDKCPDRFFDLTYTGGGAFTLALFLGFDDAHPDVQKGPRTVEITGTSIPELLTRAAAEIARMSDA